MHAPTHTPSLSLRRLPLKNKAWPTCKPGCLRPSLRESAYAFTVLVLCQLVWSPVAYSHEGVDSRLHQSLQGDDCWVQAVTAQEQAFVPEVEEDEEMPEAAAAATSSAPDQARDTSASSAGQQPTAGAQPGPSPGVAAGGPGAPDQAAGESWPDQATEESQPKPEGSSLHRLAAEDPGVGSFGLEVRKRPEGLLSREQLRAQAAAAARGEAANAGGPAQPPPGGLLANLVLLQRGGRIGGEEEEEAVEEAAVEAVHPREAGWQPPQGQKGDGRTKLNDLLGY